MVFLRSGVSTAVEMHDLIRCTPENRQGNVSGEESRAHAQGAVAGHQGSFTIDQMA